MEAKRIGKIVSGQDGAICNGYLFRFDTMGKCSVYCMQNLGENPVPVSEFVVDQAHFVAPHSNSVSFGTARYSNDDAFPLLYTNVYNNYGTADNKMKGVTCVYRLKKSGDAFSAALVQLIEIGFSEDPLWRSEHCEDVRPYGNFAIDGDAALYYAFTMRDEEKSTRYFAFDLPDVHDGIFDGTLGAKRVMLRKEDVKFFFDCEYHRYVQGACFRDGILYSLEGFTDSEENPPAVRRIDVNAKKQKDVYYFADCGTTIEPEFIEFEGDTCYYGDEYGNLYELTF